MVPRGQQDASHWRAEERLDEYLKRWNIVAIEERHARPGNTFATRRDASVLSNIDSDETSALRKHDKVTFDGKPRVGQRRNYQQRYEFESEAATISCRLL